jgi:opacity protein-like surface antigen
LEFGNSTSSDEILTGWHLGIGAERRITSRLALRLEYRHQEFEELIHSPHDPRIDVDPDESLVRLGIALGF